MRITWEEGLKEGLSRSGSLWKTVVVGLTEVGGPNPPRVAPSPWFGPCTVEEWGKQAEHRYTHIHSLLLTVGVTSCSQFLLLYHPHKDEV